MDPSVSVVVPSKDRPDGLARLLAGLSRQTLDRERIEVIVVDDGSEPPVRVEAGEPAVRVLRHDFPRGPAAARNTGWRAARAPLVGFIDDDCVPAPEWAAAVVAAAAGAGDRALIQGPVGPPPGETRPETPLTHTVRVEGPSPLAVSCNVAYARALLERTGGFDERFRRACGEDVDLGARALRAGARIVWSGDAVVHHEVRPLGLAGTLRQISKWTDAVRVVGMHPELRGVLSARVFWKPSHPLLALAAIGIATRIPAVAVVAALPYLRHHARGHGGAKGLARWLPAHVAIDVCEVATMVAGSVRHRTLML